MCPQQRRPPPRAVHGHDPDRFVQIGSLTKVLTGTALMRMSHAGVLDAGEHNGATKDASVFTGVLPDGRWLLLHRLGGSRGRTDKLGAELLARLPA